MKRVQSFRQIPHDRCGEMLDKIYRVLFFDPATGKYDPERESGAEEIGDVANVFANANLTLSPDAPEASPQEIKVAVSAFVEALKAFEEAAHAVSMTWDKAAQATGEEELDAEPYPFSLGFESTAEMIGAWRRATEKKWLAVLQEEQD